MHGKFWSYPHIAAAHRHHKRTPGWCMLFGRKQGIFHTFTISHTERPKMRAPFKRIQCFVRLVRLGHLTLHKIVMLNSRQCAVRCMYMRFREDYRKSGDGERSLWEVAVWYRGCGKTNVYFGKVAWLQIGRMYETMWMFLDVYNKYSGSFEKAIAFIGLISCAWHGNVKYIFNLVLVWEYNSLANKYCLWPRSEFHRLVRFIFPKTFVTV